MKSKSTNYSTEDDVDSAIMAPEADSEMGSNGIVINNTAKDNNNETDDGNTPSKEIPNVH